MPPNRGLAETSGHPVPRPTDEPGRVKVLPEGRHFTVRGVAVGLLIGLVICFSNMYFGLQTGWISMMTMPASLMGFGIFKLLSRHLAFPFSPVENVLVQSVAGGMAIVPLGCGFVGVIPAMEDLLKPSEQGPLHLSMWKLIIWSLGLCYFGVIFAVPLRRQVIIREQLKFPSGFSTAVLIGVLHGKGQNEASGTLDPSKAATFGSLALENRPLVEAQDAEDDDARVDPVGGPYRIEEEQKYNWKRNIRLLLITFGISGVYTICTYFLPILRNLPIFGTVAADTWLWTLNPSLAYVGQGIIMGPETTIHMLLGAILGWAVLSPLAKNRGWAPGPIDDWGTGSKGWIVWTSLAIMLADAVISLSFIAFGAAVQYTPALVTAVKQQYDRSGLKSLFGRRSSGYMAIETEDVDSRLTTENRDSTSTADDVDLLPSPAFEQRHDRAPEAWDHDDAPPEQLVGGKIVSIGLVGSILFCVASIYITFGDLVPLYATFIAVLMALILSIMGVRALGETDLNPVSGISKLAQLFFALIIPQSHKSSVLINLVAGAVSEAGAMQAGDLMQDLKTGHLLGAAPNAQFWGQVIGATVGAVVSAFIYRLYTSVYEVPGELFQVPTAFVWIFTARLVTGEGLPPMAREFAIGAAVIFAVFTVLRTRGAGRAAWHPYVPGGIAVAVGMYNVPSFTLARTIGGLANWYWRVRLGREDTPLIVLASGFILGEGFLSIVNLILQSLRVPHLGVSAEPSCIHDNALPIYRRGEAFDAGRPVFIIQSDFFPNATSCIPNLAEAYYIIEMTTYQYSPLSTEEFEIRLLNLQPGGFSDPIRVTLKHTVIPLSSRWSRGIRVPNDSEAESHQHPAYPSFEALSYAWGSIDNPKPIILDGAADGANTIMVTENLDVALRHLRRTGENRTLWIDAICIDQNNVAERGHQVSMMPNVYARASQVLIWLGPEEDDSDHAMGLLDYLGRRVVVDIAELELRPSDLGRIEPELADSRVPLRYSERDTRAIGLFFNRPWFERLWVRQEVYASTHASLQCGYMLIDWRHFESAVWAISQKCSISGTEPQFFSYGMGLAEKIVFAVHFGYNHEVLRWSSQGLKCTDPRDFIYAIQCLFELDDPLLGIKPDYSIEPTKLFIDKELLSSRSVDGSWNWDQVYQRLSSDMAVYLRAISTALAGRHFFSSSEGYIGLAPSETRSGDIICVILGCRSPIVLRRAPAGGSKWNVVGPCHVQGLMHGEGIYGALPGYYRPVGHKRLEPFIDGQPVGMLDERTQTLKTDPAEFLTEMGIRPTHYERKPHRLEVAPEVLREAGVRLQDFDLI
ncbi:hypothetical protein DL769_007730 [Monosporascus sp. CRB-8-3]|nr:hypothetical protein DL769_007730 [Monosporascus sp. CRB-8-3]